MKNTQTQAPIQHAYKIANPQAASHITLKQPVAAKPVLLRVVIGDQLRKIRQEQKRTLREVSRSAQVSLGYLSEVERGQKEASSELLASICKALGVSLSTLLIEVSADLASQEAAFDRLMSI